MALNPQRSVPRISSIVLIVGVAAVAVGLVLLLISSTLVRPGIIAIAIGIGLWLYAALEKPDRTMAVLTSRSARYGSNTTLMILAFVGILVLVNILANRYSSRFDLTADQIYTLSPRSIKIAQNLKQPVKVVAFYQTGQPGQSQFEVLLKEYQRYTNQISFKVVDPVLNPGLARQFNVQQYGTAVFESGNRHQSITTGDESNISAALLKLERTKPKIVYYLTGHGELDFASTANTGGSQVMTLLQNEDYDLKALNLAAAGSVPKDAAAVIVAAPSTAMLPAETTALETYLDNGGSALFLTDFSHRTPLVDIAHRYGVDIGSGIVIDPAQSMMNDPLSPLINHYDASPITKSLPMVLFQTATSVTPAKTPAKGFSVQPLAETTGQSWLETNPKVVHFDPGVDPKGPLTVAVEVTRAPATPSSTPPAKGRMVFIGDLAFATNQLSSAVGNGSLLVNSVNWVAEDESLIGVQAKPQTDRSLVLSNTELNLILISSVVLLPAAVLVVGGLIVWTRR